MNIDKLKKIAEKLYFQDITPSDISDSVKSEINETVNDIGIILLNESMVNHDVYAESTVLRKTLEAFGVLKTRSASCFTPGDKITDGTIHGTISDVLPLTNEVHIQWSDGELTKESANDIYCTKKKSLLESCVMVSCDSNGHMKFGAKTFAPNNNVDKAALKESKVPIARVKNNGYTYYYAVLTEKHGLECTIPLVETQCTAPDLALPEFDFGKDEFQKSTLNEKKNIISEAIMSLEGDPSFIMKFHDIVLENLNMNNAKSVFEKSIVNYVKKYGQITENSINQIEGSLIDIEKSFACDDKEEFTDDSVKAEKPNSNEIIQKARLSSVVDSLITAMHMDHNNKTALENTVVSAMYSLSNMGSNILDIKEHEYATGVFVIDDKKTVKVQNVFDERNYNIKEALKPMVAVQNMLMESVTSETPVNKDKVKSLFNNSISYFVGKGKILGEI